MKEREAGFGLLWSAVARLWGRRQVRQRWCALAEEEVRQSGIWLAEEIVAPELFFGYLAARGLVPAIEVMLDDSHIVQRGHQRH